MYTYFNPRTRVGCDLSTMQQAALELNISIHAPAWGATPLYLEGLLMLIISIHAPAWGAT